MCKNLFIIIIILSVSIVSCSKSGYNIGTWIGKTSQNFDITIKVEKVKGNPTVTELKYSIKMIEANYSAMTTIQQPIKLSAKITDGKFSYSENDYKIWGIFEGNALYGELSSTSIRPPEQSWGTASANVTFSLEKDDAK